MTRSQQHTEKAKTDLDTAPSFEVVAETAPGTIEYTAVVDETTYAGDRTAAHKRLWLLGHHIRCLTDELGSALSPEQAATLALEATEPGDQPGDSDFVFR